MKRTTIFFSYALLALLFFSCNSESTSPLIDITLEKTSLNKINITQTDYNTFSVSSNDDFIINSKEISKIMLGENIYGTFKVHDATEANYKKVGNNTILNFSLSKKFDESSFNHNFEIRYLTKANLFHYVDTSIATYKYPYPSTEIFIHMKNVFESPTNDVQSFAFVKRKLFYHPYGSAGLFEYNMSNKSKKLVFDYSGGDYIAASDKYVFCDLRKSIYRYNLVTGAVDLNTHVLPNSTYFITGMDVYKDNLYVSTEEGKMLIYDMDIQLKETLPYNDSLSYLAIYDNTAYSYNFEQQQLSRYSLTTQKFLEAIPMPAHNVEAISIIDDMMFFTELTKETISYFKLSDINKL